MHLNLSFFKQVERLSREMRQARRDGSEAFSPPAVHCFKLLFTYMMSCKWHDTRRNRELMTYITLSDSKAAEKMGVSSNTVRSMRSTASNKLFSLIGADCFDIIRCGSSEERNRLKYKLLMLVKGYDDIKRFIPKQIIDEALKVERTQDKEYSIKDCVSELRFLGRFDMIDLHESVISLDEDKLAFVIETLMGMSGSDLQFEILSGIIQSSESFKRKYIN